MDHAEPRYDIDENIGFIGAGQVRTQAMGWVWWVGTSREGACLTASCQSYLTAMLIMCMGPRNMIIKC